MPDLSSPGAVRLRGWLLAGVVLVAARIGYHAVYLGEVPFALATFSDGAVYEASARDLAEHFPLGTQPFWLQGLYAYLLALPLLVAPWISLGLLLQLGVAGLAIWVFHRTMRRVWGPEVGRLSTFALLAYPALAFYENKYLSASLGVAADVFVLAAVVWAVEGRARRGLLAGAATGLSILARPNLVLAVPAVAWACGRDRSGPGRARMLAALALGLAGALSPMALRNLAVTGHADLFPVHGGGTSFFIGNNPHARGVWNDAGGLLSARVEHESAELAQKLDVDAASERDRAVEIGRRLYGEGLAFVRDEPGAWARLEVAKLFLTLGNDELTQDYDWWGERELLPNAHVRGLPFGLLLGLAVVGIAVRRRAARPGGAGLAAGGDRVEAAVAITMAGQALAIVAAILVYFTSSQHRLPLCVPLAVYAGPGAFAIGRAVARRGCSGLAPAVFAVAALAAAQAFWPRTSRHTPHPVHHYNLSIAFDQIGDPAASLAAIDVALAARPDQPLFRLRRAVLLDRLGDRRGARADAERVLEQPDLPDDVRASAHTLLDRIGHDAAAAGLPSATE
jgi:hypothetical protein